MSNLVKHWVLWGSLTGIWVRDYFQGARMSQKQLHHWKTHPNMGGIAKAASLNLSAVCWQLVVKYSSLCCRELFIPFYTTRERSWDSYKLLLCQTQELLFTSLRLWDAPPSRKDAVKSLQRNLLKKGKYPNIISFSVVMGSSTPHDLIWDSLCDKNHGEARYCIGP